MFEDIFSKVIFDLSGHHDNSLSHEKHEQSHQESVSKDHHPEVKKILVKFRFVSIFILKKSNDGIQGLPHLLRLKYLEIIGNNHKQYAQN